MLYIGKHPKANRVLMKNLLRGALILDIPQFCRSLGSILKPPEALISRIGESGIVRDFKQ